MRACVARGHSLGGGRPSSEGEEGAHLAHDLGRRERARLHLVDRRAVDQEAAHGAAVGVRARPHEEDVGERRVGDPRLAAREHPLARLAVPNGARLHARRVAAVVGLRQAEAAHRLARREAGQPLRLVRVARAHRRPRGTRGAGLILGD
jgi:hypothetical protein